MKKSLLILLFLTTQIFAQSPDWEWATINSGSNHDNMYGIATDLTGNIYMTGYFDGDSVRIGDSVLYKTVYSNAIFLVKSSSSGNVIWTKVFNGSQLERGLKVATDPNGNIYLTGYFASDSLTFGNTTLHATSSGDFEVFVTKLDSNGNVMWAKSFQGGADDEPTDISVDNNGNVYITGFSLSSTLTIGSIVLNKIGGRYAIFLVKFDTNGVEQWAHTAGGDKDANGRGVCNDNAGNIYLTGHFSGPSITIGTSTLYGNNIQTYCLIKFDTNGNVIWATSKNNATGINVCTDSSSNVYSIGCYRGTLTFGTTSLLPFGGLDSFIAKYDSTGQVQWARSIHGDSTDIVVEITHDANDDIYLGGYYISDSLQTLGSTLYTNGWNDFFISKISSTGNEIWSKSTGGLLDDALNGIACDQHGGVFIVGGTISTQVYFDTISLIRTSTLNGFFAKMNGGLTNIENIENTFFSSTYPNPCNGKFRISTDFTGTFEMKIYNLIGEVIYQNYKTTEQTEVNISNQTSGIYIYRLHQDQKISVGKIILK